MTFPRQSPVWLAAAVLCGWCGTAIAQNLPPVITKPAQVWWGAFRNNEQLVDGGSNQWTFVQQNMDGYLLHGAYWNFTNNPVGSVSPTNVGPKLATILSNAGSKPVMLEHLLAGEFPDVRSAFGTAFAGTTNDPAAFTSGIGNIKRLKGYGFNLNEVSTDYIMETWKRSARFHPHWTSEEFFTAVSGNWETYAGTIFNTNTGSSDRNTFGWFRQWLERLVQAFPTIRVSPVNSPVYFSWNDGGDVLRELGPDFSSYSTWLKLERRGTNVAVLYSADGSGWRSLTNTAVPLGAAPLAGFFVSSLNTNRAAQGRFDNIQTLPFFEQDIGAPGSGGSETFSGTSIVLRGTGDDGLHPGNPSSDSHYFVYAERSGDQTFTVRLDSMAGSNPNRTNPAGEIPMAGLTLRESTNAGARQVSAHVNLAGQIEFMARATNSGGLVTLTNVPGATLPRWIRLQRTGSTFAASHSGDGTNWTNVGSTTISNASNNLLAGLVADSQVRYETNTATFSQFSFLPTNTPSYAGASIGAVGTNASSSGTGATNTVVAAGTGAIGTSDALRFHQTAWTNDGTVSARLVYFADHASPATNLAAGAQMGVMFRADTNAGSPHVAAVFTPQQGVQALARTAPNGATTTLAQLTNGPVIATWNSYRPLLRYFTGDDFLRTLHQSFPSAFSNNFTSFNTDSPYRGYQAWGGSEANVDAVRHRRKIILYEQWLQQNGREHYFIANSTGGSWPDTSTPAGRDAWDLQFKQDSMRSLQLHQLEGGRPDRVIFESWYEGPFSMVPETKNGSYANTVRDAIYYVKGLGQSLDLQAKAGAATNTNAWTSVGATQTNPLAALSNPVVAQTAIAMGAPVTFTVRLTNTGTVPALPVLHAHESGGSGWTGSYVLSSGGFTSNITAGITSPNGQAVTDSAQLSGTELIEASKAVDVTVTVTPNAALAKRNILLRAFWNPQDPSLAARDAISLEVAPPSELVQSGGFEGGISGWTSTGGAIAAESGTVRSGTGAIRSFNRSAVWNGPQQSLLGRLIPGQTYLVTAWARTDSPANLRASIRYEGTSGAPVFHNVSTVNGVDNSGWFQLQGYYRHSEPNGPATVLNLYFETTGSPNYLGPLYLDDVSVTLVSPVWTDTQPGARGWSTTTSWQSGNAPVSAAFNSIAFFPGQTVSTGSVTAIQNLGANFLLNALTLGGLAPTNGAAAVVSLSSNSLSFVAHDGSTPRLALEAAGTNLSYAVSVPLALSNNLTVQGDGSARFLFSGAISGPGSLNKTGASTVTLAASNGFSGGAVLSAGGIIASNHAALGTGDVVIAGGNLRGPSSNEVVLPNPLVLSSDTVTGGRLTFTGPVQMTGGNRTVTVDSGQVALNGAVSDDAPRNLIKSGAGTLVLAGSNSYRGVTTISDGVLRVAGGGALGSPGTSSNGFTFLSGANALATMEVAGNVEIAEVFKMAMHNTVGHEQVRNVSGANELRGPLLLEGGGGRWDIGSAGGLLEMSGLITNTVASNDTWRVLNLHGPGAGVISGPTGDTRSGTNGSLLGLTVQSGTWTLTGPGKAHQGTTTVAGGTLILDAALSAPVVVNAGARLEGVGGTTGPLSVSGTVAPGNSPGALAGGAATFAPGMTYEWDIADWNGAPGTGYDTMNLASINLAATTNNPAVIQPMNAGLTNFSETSKSFLLATATNGITNFAPGRFLIQPAGFPGAGTWSVTASNNTLLLHYAADPYAAWSNGIAWNGADSSAGADPDGDGLTNFAEYALGGNPLKSDPATRPQAGWATNRLTLTFRRTADPAIIYEVLGWNNFATNGVPFWTSTAASNVPGPVTVTDSVPLGSQPQRFLQLRIRR
jgi:autotransporter-associated beta strand protein